MEGPGTINSLSILMLNWSIINVNWSRRVRVRCEGTTVFVANSIVAPSGEYNGASKPINYSL